MVEGILFIHWSPWGNWIFVSTESLVWRLKAVYIWYYCWQFKSKSNHSVRPGHTSESFVGYDDQNDKCVSRPVVSLVSWGFRLWLKPILPWRMPRILNSVTFLSKVVTLAFYHYSLQVLPPFHLRYRGISTVGFVSILPFLSMWGHLMSERANARKKNPSHLHSTTHPYPNPSKIYLKKLF